MSHRAPAQRLTNAFAVNPSTAAPIFTLAALTTALTNAGAQQVGSLFVAPSFSAVNTALTNVSASTTAAVNQTLIDLGKTLTVQVNDATDGAMYVKFQSVKRVTGTSSGVTGYVVVENNYQLFSGDKGKVLVARV